MSFAVKGKTAIVTGAGSGICYHFTKVLLERGCNVVMADLTLRPEAKDLQKAFASGDTRAVFQKTDVTEWAQLDRAFDIAEKEFGGYDILCPGAGVFEPHWSNFWYPVGSPESKDDRSQSRIATLDINLIHPIYASQKAIQHFSSKSKPGSIVHIASIAAQLPIASTPIYCASKGGITQFVRALAMLEQPPSTSRIPGIRVTAVAPGVIKTPLWTEHPEKTAWLDQSKDEWVEPEDVALAMLSLIEEEEHVGGTVLEVGKNQTRKVSILNDPGPSGAGHTVGGMDKAAAEVWESLERM